MLTEFWTFIANVLANWLATVTGGIIAVIILLIEHRTGRSVTWKALWSLLGFGLFVSCFLAWHNEHRNSEVLIKEKASISGQLASCTANSRASNAVRQLLETQTGSQQLTIDTQQSTINKCVFTLSKMAVGEPSYVHTWTVGIGIVKRPIITEIILVTNRLQTVRGNLECNEPFNIFDWTMTGAGVRMDVRTQKISANQYRLETTSPLWEPQAPVVVNTASDETLHDCKFTLEP